jgi:hypothetical protein
MSSDPVTSSFSPLRELSSLITSSLNTLESTCKDVNVPWPSLDEPVYMSKTGIRQEDFTRMKNEAVVRASAQLVAAAMQLVRSVKEPFMTVVQAGSGVSSLSAADRCDLLNNSNVPLLSVLQFCLSSAIRTATELHVADILRDAGPEVCTRYSSFARLLMIRYRL